MSRIIANSYRHTGASADAITLDASGNATFPANVTCSGTATGFGGGKLLQVVTASTTTTATTTGTTYEDTNLTATISISANSKVLVLVTQNYEIRRIQDFCAADIKLVRGSTDIWVSTNQKIIGFGEADVNQKTLLNVLSISFLDTGASTGSNTYKTQQRVQVGSDTPRIRTQDDNNPSQITLLEIGS